MESFGAVKQSIIDTIHDYRKNHPALSPNQDDTDNALLSYLASTKGLTSWSQVNALTGLYARNFQAGLDPFSGTSLPFSQAATCTPFAQGIGWYYVSSSKVTNDPTDPYASMTLMIFRKPIMTKKVAASKGYPSLEKASVWAVAGGYTVKGSKGEVTWRVIGDGSPDFNHPTNVTVDSRPGTTKGIYSCGLSNSSSPTYLSILLEEMGVVDPATGKTKNFGSAQPSKWSVSLTATKGFTELHATITEIWLEADGATTKTVPVVDVDLTTTSPGVWNAKNGCSCACGLGSWYGSQPYFHLKKGTIGGVTLVPTEPTPRVALPLIPSGWLDRQRISVWTSSSNFICQLFATWKLWLGSLQPASWIWGTVQPVYKPGDTAYADPVVYMYAYTGLDVSLMKPGHTFTTPRLMLHRYHVATGGADYKVNGSLTLEATSTNKFGPSNPFPCAYTLKVDGKTLYLRLPVTRSSASPSYPKPWPPLQIPSLGTMLLPPLIPAITGTNIECHGYLYDAVDAMEPSGTCFFEAMAFDPQDLRLKRGLVTAGLEPSSSTLEIFRSKKLTLKQAAPTLFTSLAFILLFLGIIVTIIVVPIVLVKRHKRSRAKAGDSSSTAHPSPPSHLSPDTTSMDTSAPSLSAVPQEEKKLFI